MDPFGVLVSRGGVWGRNWRDFDAKLLIQLNGHETWISMLQYGKLWNGESQLELSSVM